MSSRHDRVLLPRDPSVAGAVWPLVRNVLLVDRMIDAKLLPGLLLLTAACTTTERAPTVAEAVPASPPPPNLLDPDHDAWRANLDDTDTLVVPLRDIDNDAVVGAVALSETADGVLFRVEVERAQPGLHGVHIHRRADCALGAWSTGGHLAPEDNEHGWPSSGEHHLGDLGNLLVEADRRGRLERVVPNTTLDDFGGYELMGRALVMHARYDDGKGYSGHAGAPVACAEIALR